MHWRISFLVACVCLSKCFYAYETTSNWRSSKDGDIFIDNDEGIEGSGGDRELKNDLEASGSGAGPDDEDTVPNPLTPVVKLPPSTTERKDDVPPVASVTTRKTPSNFDEVNTINEPKERPKLDPNDNSVTIMNQKPPYEDRAASFFAQPGILAAVIGGAVVGLLCAILVVMFIVYRMRKKDEGSYALDEPKRSPLVNSYGKGHQTEFYA